MNAMIMLIFIEIIDLESILCNIRNMYIVSIEFDDRKT